LGKEVRIVAVGAVCSLALLVVLRANRSQTVLELVVPTPTTSQVPPPSTPPIVTADLNANPEKLLAKSAAALRDVRSYELEAQMGYYSRFEKLSVIRSGPSSMSISVTVGRVPQRTPPASLQVLRVPAGFYVRGNFSFLVGEGAPGGSVSG
jgi:hypothetical protein